MKSSAYIQSWEPHPGTKPRISFSIAPARIPDEIGDYRRDSEKKRNSDIYVFALYTAREKEQNIMDMSLWEFYVVPTSVLDEKFGEQKTLSLARLEGMGCKKTSFMCLGKEIEKVCSTIQPGTGS